MAATRIFIIAGNYQQFREYQRKGYSDDLLLYQNLVYVSDVMTLKGIHKPRGRFIGTWYRREDLGDIIMQLRLASSIDEEKLEEILAHRRRYLSNLPKR